MDFGQWLIMVNGGYLMVNNEPLLVVDDSCNSGWFITMADVNENPAINHQQFPQLHFSIFKSKYGGFSNINQTRRQRMADTAPKALQTIAQQLAIATVYGVFLMMFVSLSLLGIFNQYP